MSVTNAVLPAAIRVHITGTLYHNCNIFVVKFFLLFIFVFNFFFFSRFPFPPFSFVSVLTVFTF